MKTGANLRKTAIRSGAVVVSFVLISFTVSAQEFWRKLITNSSFNEIAIAMIETDRETSTTGNAASAGAEWDSFDMAFDPALELEGWMSDRSHFDGVGLNEPTESEDVDAEDSGLYDEGTIAAGDESLAVEGWMVDEAVWVR